MSPHRGTGGRRPTIADIAAKAGVSAGAVSYALNGRPGVSAETRRRVRQVAEEVGWTPNNAARALSGVGAATVGLVITRPASVLGIEPFFMSFVAGIEEVLAQSDIALLLKIARHADRELDTYQGWWSARRVDGVFVTDLRLEDPRIKRLNDLGLPAVVVGDPEHAAPLPAVWSDDAVAASQAMRHLAGLGHRRIGHIAGPADLVHTVIRSRALRAAGLDHGISQIVEVHADYTLESGAQATQALLRGPGAPTALVLDNDLMALAAVQVARERGLNVPEDLSILAWDDSALCRLTSPPLSALSRDVAAYGADAARLLLDVIAGREPHSVRSSVARLIDRGSLARVTSDTY